MPIDDPQPPFLISWLVSGLAVFLTSKIVRGFEIRGFLWALLASVVIGLANAVVWPILFFLTLPLNILTLGLLTFVINGAVLKLSAAVMPGFELKSWFAAIVGSIVLSLLNVFLHFVFF